MRNGAMHHTYFLQLFEDPLVFTIKSGWKIESGFSLCVQHAKGKPFHVLISPAWYPAAIVHDLTRFVSKASVRYPAVQFYVMCPTEEDVALVKSHGLNTVFAHQNAFIDETIFRPDDYATRRKRPFRAVHNAAFGAWKRHDLAWGVKDIAVITYRHHADDDINIIWKYKSLAWSNASKDGKIDYLSAHRVAEILNHSKSGLILSATEGANYASSEYQFCGLPLVTTDAEGGRMAFLDETYTRIVAPEARAVENAVDYWEKAAPDPVEIHKRTIQRAIPHRLRLLDWLKEVTGENVHVNANANAWYPTFHDKLRRGARYDPAQLLPPILQPATTT